MEIFPNAISQDEACTALVVSQLKTFTQVYQGVLKAYVRAFDDIWNNDKFTPQEIIAKYDTRALKLFQNSSLTCNYLMAVDPTALPLQYQSAPMAWSPELLDGQPTGRVFLE